MGKQHRRVEDRDAVPAKQTMPGRRVRRSDDDDAAFEGAAWGGGRGIKAQAGAPAGAPFRDDLHGGDPAAHDDDYGQAYAGSMREYRGSTRGGYKAVPTAHAEGDELGMQPRPDQSVMEDVVDLLARDRGVDDNRIQVYVEDGVVLMEGTTFSERSLNHAIRLARLVAGVVDVRSRVRIESPTNRP